MSTKHQVRQLKIELPESKAEGSYSNFTLISHSGAEFIIDFARVVPGVPKAIVQSRIIMTPIHTKTLLYTIRDNISKFESKFGEIKIPEKSEGFPTFELKPPSPDEMPN